MKKSKLNGKLKLNKQIIARLDDEQMNSIKGGYLMWTSGCTDGCTGSATFGTAWRCTKADCSGDCDPEPNGCKK